MTQIISRRSPSSSLAAAGRSKSIRSSARSRSTWRCWRPGSVADAVERVDSRRRHDGAVSRSAAGASCPARRGDGFLPVRQCGDRRPAGDRRIGSRSRADHRLGRASRQRHARDLLARRAGRLLLGPSLAILSRHGRREGDRRRAGARHEAQSAARIRHAAARIHRPLHYGRRRNWPIGSARSSSCSAPASTAIAPIRSARWDWRPKILPH